MLGLKLEPKILMRKIIIKNISDTLLWSSDYTLAMALQLPGYQQYCCHQHRDLEDFKENLHMFDALIASDRSSSTARTVIVAVFWVESLSWKPFSVALRDSFSYDLMPIPNVEWMSPT